MSGKLDRRRSRARRQRRGILTLWGNGRSVAEISRRVGTSERAVEKVIEAAGIKQMFDKQEEQTKG